MARLIINLNNVLFLVFWLGIVIAALGIVIAVRAFRSAELHQRKFFREPSKFDESLKRDNEKFCERLKQQEVTFFDKLKEQEVDTLRKLYCLEGPSEVGAVSEVLWKKDWASNSIPKWTANAIPDLVISTEQEKYTITSQGQELMIAIDKELANRLRNRQTSQPGFTIAQIIREEDLRELYSGLVEYNIAHQDEKFVDLRTFIGVLNAFLESSVN